MIKKLFTSKVPASSRHLLYKKLTPREARALAALDEHSKKGQIPSKT